jgi:hypothetical protein
MTNFSLLAVAAVAALGAAACSGNQSARNETQSAATSSTPSATARTTTPAPSATPAPAQQAQTTPAPGATTTAPAAPTTFTDAQLRSFAAAATEIDPISRTLATATPEQQAAAAEQIRQILSRNNIDSATYNAIAAQAQRDPTFAARIQTLSRQG